MANEVGFAVGVERDHVKKRSVLAVFFNMGVEFVLVYIAEYFA